jgi:hypothetical protein
MPSKQFQLLAAVFQEGCNFAQLKHPTHIFKKAPRVVSSSATLFESFLSTALIEARTPNSIKQRRG